jgi:hypothetical protein
LSMFYKLLKCFHLTSPFSFNAVTALSCNTFAHIGCGKFHPINMPTVIKNSDVMSSPRYIRM